MKLSHKKKNHLIRTLAVMVLLILSVMLTVGESGADNTYDFAGLGSASGGFKPQGNRFLVSSLFEDDSAGGRPTAICYNTTGLPSPAPKTVNGIIIKADGTNLISFDLKDMGFGIYPGGVNENITSLKIIGTKVGGGTVTTTVAPGERAAGATFSLVGLAGLDLSGFTNITQLQFDITTIATAGDVWDIDFMTITLANEVQASSTPTTQATAVQTVVAGATELNLGWTSGNGGSRVVFAKQGATSGGPVVTDGTTYAANSVFSSATDSGNGWKCVYNGNGNSVSLTGLSASTQYRFVVFEYNGSSGHEKYLTTGTGNALNQATIASFGAWSSGRARTADLSTDVQFAMADAERDSSGNTYVVHRSDSNWTTEIQKWNGSSWATLTSTTPSAGGYTSFSLTGSNYPFTNYRLAATGVDNLRVATVAEKGTALDSQRGIVQATYNGSAWSFQDVAVYSDPNNYIRCDRPVIAVDGAGNSHILYEHLAYSGTTTYTQYLKLASWNGSGWSYTVLNTIPNSGNGNQVSPDYLLLNDTANKQHVFYFVDTTATSRDLHYWTNASGSVTDTTLFSGSAETPGGIHGAVDSSGKLHVTYFVNPSGGLGVKYLTNVSGSWVTSTLLAPGSGSPLELRINGNGDMLIPVWSGSTNTFRTLLKQGSNPWSISAVSPTAAPEGAVSIGVTFRDDGMAMFAYSNDRSLTPRVLGYSLASLWNTAPIFVGSTTTLTVNQNAAATDVKELLHVSDLNAGQTETWTVTGAPSHGSLSGFPATAASGSTDITPGGTITYAPASGYGGSDSFTIQVSDGTATATRTISVTVNPTYTVTYNGNGSSSGNVPADSNSYLNDATVTVLGNTGGLVRTGYTFAGWTKAPDGSGTTYVAGNTFTMGAANVTLYAKWSINSYTVSFNSNGGSEVTSQSVAYNSTATAPTAPTKTGYTFAGWYSDSGLTTAFNFSTAITADTTLYAKWNINTYTLAINFAGNGSGTVTSTAPDSAIHCIKGSSSGCSADYTAGTSVTLAATGDWKSLFTGWSGGVTSSATPVTFTMDAAKTVTATFDPNNKVKLLPGSVVFASIQDAYASVSSGTITIQAQAWPFLEDLLFNKGTAVTLTGGMDSGYNPTSGYSTVKSLAVGTGSVVIGNITIK